MIMVLISIKYLWGTPAHGQSVIPDSVLPSVFFFQADSLFDIPKKGRVHELSWVPP